MKNKKYANFSIVYKKEPPRKLKKTSESVTNTNE